MRPEPTNSLDISPILPQTNSTHESAENAGLERFIDRAVIHPKSHPQHPRQAQIDAARKRLAAIHHPTTTKSTVRHATLFNPLASSGLGADGTLTQPNYIQPKPKTRHLPKHNNKSNKIKAIVTAIGFFGLILILFKLPIIINQITYLTAPKAVTPVVITPVATPVISPDSILSIPKINVSVPVIFEPTAIETNIQKALQTGVVHYAGTANPGEASNTVIVGHSSNDWWEAGNFKFVFVLLDKLAVGDTLSINYNSVKYVYQVTETKVVEPTEVSVLAATSEPTLTLITCTPPGTSWKRLIVRAKQISPVAKVIIAAPKPTGITPTSLPSSALGFLEQIGNFFSSIFGGKNSSSTGVQPSGVQLPGAK